MNKFHGFDKIWHISLHYIAMDVRKQTSIFLNAMNDIN